MFIGICSRSQVSVSRTIGPLVLFSVLGESDIIYTTTLLGLDRGNSYKDKTVLILGGGDGGLLHELLQLSPRFVSMVEVRILEL